MQLLSVVIPFYNEEENVFDVLEGVSTVLDKAELDYEIIAVNNGSSDKTPEIIGRFKSKEIRPLHIRKNEGYGNGILKGLEIAKGDCLGFMPGDNEVKPETVLLVYKKLLNEKLDVCKINRTTKNYSFFRKLESNVYNKIFARPLFGYKLGDVNGCPKIMTRQAYKKLNLKYKDYFFDTEIMVKAIGLGLKIGQVSAVYSWRKKGKSSVKPYIALEFIKNAVKFKIGLLLNKV